MKNKTSTTSHKAVRPPDDQTTGVAGQGCPVGLRGSSALCCGEAPPSQHVPPVVSVVFPTFERRNDIVLTLERLRSGLRIPYEVVILDNSPVPSAADHLFAANEQYVFLGKNMGTTARNLGVSKATAPYILMLDDDSHPLTGAVERAVEYLALQPKEVAGLGARIERTDGGREGPPLLPTAFHGCGALFRRDALLSCGDVYPGEFGFYAEEYWVTFLLYSNGFRLAYADEFRVCHRLSSAGRSKKKILFHLTRNNDCVWQAFTPNRYLEDALYDTNRRYELIAHHEGVPEAFIEGRTCLLPPPFRKPMDEDSFRQVSLLSSFDKLLAGTAPRDKMILCGVGKFPSMWAKHLTAKGIKNVALTDFNKALWGNEFERFTVIDSHNALALMAAGFLPVVGHSSRTDADAWRTLMASKGVPFHDLALG